MLYRYYQSSKTYYRPDTKSVCGQKDVLEYFQTHPNENIRIVDADSDEDLTAFFLLKVLIYFERDTRQVDAKEIRAIADRLDVWRKFE